MKRSLLIAVLVLVPFAGLVAFGFSLLKDPAPLVIPERPAVGEPQPALAPVKVGGPVRAALDVSIPVKAAAPIPVPALVPSTLPLPSSEPDLPAEPPSPPDPITTIVEPRIQQCFRDIAARVKGPIRVTVAFDVTAAGSYAAVSLKKASWPDPHLEACVVDAFEDVKFEPIGLPVRRQSRTFNFGTADGGR